MTSERPFEGFVDGLTIELTEAEVIADLDSWFVPDVRDSEGAAA
jgi:hypothetical protein